LAIELCSTYNLAY